MGYYIETENVNVIISAANVPAAFEAVKALNKRDELKGGGRFPKRGLPEDNWFAWMPWNYDQTVESIADVFQLLGFEHSSIDDDGYFHLSWYNSKTGDEEHFLNAIAPYVESGSVIEWRGEDNERWRNHFLDGQMRTEHPEVTWTETYL